MSAINNSTPIRAIIFDVGGVLIPSPIAILSNAEGRAGVDKGIFLEIYKSKEFASLLHEMDRGEVCVEEFEERVKEYQAKKANSQTSNQQKMSVERVYPIIPAMLDAVKGLKTNGFTTAILTNNWFVDYSKTRTVLPLDTTLFDVIVESCRLGMRKPDPEIYKLLLAKLQCQPEECVYLEDTLEQVESARALGIRTIHVSPAEPEKAVQELEQILQTSLTTISG